MQACYINPYSPHRPHTRQQTTASDSALTAVVAARSRYRRAHPHVPHEQLVVYTTTQTHSLGAKAALVLGLPIRALPVTSADMYALRGDVFRAAVEEDRNIGRHPFILSERAPHVMWR